MNAISLKHSAVDDKFRNRNRLKLPAFLKQRNSVISSDPIKAARKLSGTFCRLRAASGANSGCDVRSAAQSPIGAYSARVWKRNPEWLLLKTRATTLLIQLRARRAALLFIADAISLFDDCKVWFLQIKNPEGRQSRESKRRNFAVFQENIMQTQNNWQSSSSLV
jgi:hypothetical protein